MNLSEIGYAEAKDDWGHGFDEDLEEAVEEVDSEEDEAKETESVDAKDEGCNIEFPRRLADSIAGEDGAHRGETGPLRDRRSLSLSASGKSGTSLQQRIFKRTGSIGDRLGGMQLSIVLPPRRSSGNLRATAERCGSPMLSTFEPSSVDGDGVDFAPSLVTPRAEVQPKVVERWSAPWELKEQEV